MPDQRSVWSNPIDKAAEGDTSHGEEGSSTAATPTWALQQATEELYDIKDTEVIAQRAREIAREGRGS